MNWQFCFPVLPESRVLLFLTDTVYDLLKLTLTTSCFKGIFECVVFMATNNK